MKSKLVIAIFVTIVVAGCQVTSMWEPTPTPLPGWRSPVSALLVEDESFPEGWVCEREFPDTPDPTINHVYRSWYDETEDWGKAEQAIWRAYTTEDAREKYAELRQMPQLLPHYTPGPYEFYAEFKPPPEIDFQSQIADEFYLACGRRNGFQCRVIARYRNYVSYMRLYLEIEYEGRTREGLTYQEIEVVVRAMDAKFADFLATHSLATPTP
jgi:hypothetical protein